MPNEKSSKDSVESRIGARACGCAVLLFVLGVGACVLPLFGYQFRAVTELSESLRVSPLIAGLVLVCVAIVLAIVGTVIQSGGIGPRPSRMPPLSAPPDKPQKRNLHPFDDYDFDFSQRQAELNHIVTKWTSQAVDEATKKQLASLMLPLRDILFELIDEGHPPGEETIKRNLDLGELCGRATVAFAVSGLCMGLEYGSLRKQPTPVESIDSIPKEVIEMFVVAFQTTNGLFLRLMSDICKAREVDKNYVAKRQENFNTTAFGVLISCYRLGVATAKENH